MSRVLFFACNLFCPYLVNRFTVDRDFLVFSPYLDRVPRMFWPSIQSICLLPSDGAVVNNPYIILVSMETECLLSDWQTKFCHKHGNQSVIQHSIMKQNIVINWDRTPSHVAIPISIAFLPSSSISILHKIMAQKTIMKHINIKIL